uniref:Geranylgeranyl transferase type-1 subunit beta n=1 Tax=Ditylenchus dipsaci TaxID=166011 RepID=A0A915DLB7_9BILA
MVTEDFLVKKHLRLINKCLSILPSAYVGFQNSRPTVLFFLISSLDILNKLDASIPQKEKSEIISWIYQLQITSSADFSAESGGFRGSINTTNNCPTPDDLHSSLLFVDSWDDLKGVDRPSILNGIRLINSENDMRFVFCAVAICYILNDFSFIDVVKVRSFIQSSVNYDGGIGQGPFCESHGGSTYCAIASLSMLGCLWDFSVLTKAQIERLKNWAIMKQKDGFHGRTNKPDDSCYAFWLGATLSMLNAQYLVNETSVRSFLMRTQDDLIGGFSKYEDSTSDALHTYFSIAAYLYLKSHCLPSLPTTQHFTEST